MLLYNSQAVSPITARLRAAARAAGIPVDRRHRDAAAAADVPAVAARAGAARSRRRSRAMSVVSVDGLALRFGERDALGRARASSSARRVPGGARPERHRQDVAHAHPARAARADRRARRRRGPPAARARHRSATCRSSARSTATRRCAAATSCGSASTAIAGASAASDADDRARVDAALAEVGAAAYADAPVGRLSGGEQQRLRVAQALVCRPGAAARRRAAALARPRLPADVVDLLDARRERAGTPVVFVTHDVNPVLPSSTACSTSPAAGGRSGRRTRC